MRILLIALFLAALSPWCVAQSSLSPANFAKVRSEFIGRLTLPALENDTVVLTRCASKVDRRGRMESIVCYDNAEYPDLSREIAGEIRRVAQFYRLAPAMSDGTSIEVWFNFSLIYRNAAGELSISLVENHLLNAGEYGENYISAQRFDLQPWHCQPGKAYVALLRANISAQGEISAVESSRQDENDNCADHLQRVVQGSRFVPAQLDGVSVPSLYTELFYVGNLYGRGP